MRANVPPRFVPIRKWFRVSSREEPRPFSDLLKVPRTVPLRALKRFVRKGDVLVGIAASGRTPFVHGALEQAKSAGAYSALICFNPEMKKARTAARTTIAPNIGPEILTGSTRLKSGTATKLILNMITTLAMVRIGKVMGNRMVDLNPSNTKLRDRATRIVQELTESDYETAREALHKSAWVVRKAVESLRGRG